MKQEIVLRCAHDLPNGFAFGIAAVAAGQCLEVTENGMTTKYQPNAANQYASIAHGTEVVEPEYDPQGNLLHDATRKYTWDADIHLMSVTTEGHGGPQRSEGSGSAGATGRGATGSVASGQASGLPHIAPHNAVDEAPSKTTTTRFLYDALHRRLGRVKDNGETTVFVYEGWNVIAEKTVRLALSGEGNNFKLETRYVWGEDLSGSLQGAGGIGGLLSSVQAGSLTKNEAPRTTNFFQYDSNGNVFLLTDSQGRESARYAYDAFGKTLTAAGPAAQMNRYRFSTKPVEEGSGLVYYGYRYYDPVTGRWPSRDPIEERGGVNLYGMVGNKGVDGVDRLGLSNLYDMEATLIWQSKEVRARGNSANGSMVTYEYVATRIKVAQIWYFCDTNSETPRLNIADVAWKDGTPTTQGGGLSVFWLNVAGEDKLEMKIGDIQYDPSSRCQNAEVTLKFGVKLGMSFSLNYSFLGWETPPLESDEVLATKTVTVSCCKGCNN